MMKKHAAVFAFLAGCTAPAPRPEPPVVPPAPAKQTAQALDDDWRRILDQAKTSSPIEQEAMAVSMEFARQGAAWMAAGDFEKSREALQAALMRWTGNREARRMLAEVNAIISGEPSRDPLSSMHIEIEQALIEIANHLCAGERLYNGREYEKAAWEFEQADFKIKHMPYEVGALKEIQPKVSEQLKTARAAAKK